MKKRRKQKPKKKQESSSSIGTPKPTTQVQQSQSKPPTEPHSMRRPHLFEKLSLGARITILAALVSIVLAGPVVFGEYDKTFPTAETSGDFDNLHPFRNTLIIRNPSAMFDMHYVKATCAFAGVYNLGITPPARLQGRDSAVYEASLITAHEPFIFNSEVGNSLFLGSTDRRTSAPFAAGLIAITIKYETWIRVWKLKIRLPRQDIIYLNFIPGPPPHWVVGQELF